MNWQEENRYRILEALSKRKDLSNEELRNIYHEFKSMFDAENLWIESGKRGNEIYNISKRGKSIYEYLRGKKTQEIINWALVIITAIAAVIAAIPVIKDWIH